MPLTSPSLLTGPTTLTGGADALGYDAGVYGTELYGDPAEGPLAAFMTRVRELPPLRTSILATTPSGRVYRWGEDEPDPANVFSGLRHSSTVPGGFEAMDCVLPRKPGVNYSDLDRLTTVQVWGAGGDLAGEYRLERAPRASGDQMSISPSAVGWQAALDDNKSASCVIIDRDLSHWTGPSTARGTLANWTFEAFAVTPGPGPGLATGFADRVWTATTKPICEAWYDAGAANRVGVVAGSWAKTPGVNAADANWSWQAFVSTDDVATSTGATGSLRAAGPGSFSLAATGGDKRYAGVQFDYGASGGVADNNAFGVSWTNLRVYGDHGLTAHGAEPDSGFYASDVVLYVVNKWAPALTATAATVSPSSYPIPHLVFPGPTTASEMVRQASRVTLPDWGVWDDKTFWWYPRGTYGRNWRTRVAPSQLSETGPQVDRLWNGVVVQFNDVDGSTRSVGPLGYAGGAHAELTDSDPDNPANEVGLNRWALLTTGVCTTATAIQIGSTFLAESKALDNSGQAHLVGHVTDDRGALHPYWRVRAGDTVAFVDAADPSPRRVVRAEHDRATRTCTVDLDAPPEGLTALLERLGVNLVTQGL